MEKNDITSEELRDFKSKVKEWLDLESKINAKAAELRELKKLKIKSS